MDKKVITLKQIQEMTDLSLSTLGCHLARFDKYLTTRNGHEKTYIYSLEFLQELKEFYVNKINSYTGLNQNKYRLVALKIQRAIEQDWK